MNKDEQPKKNGFKISSENIKTILLISGLLISGVAGWITLKSDVKANAEDIARACVAIDKGAEVNKQQNDDIIKLQANVDAVQKDVNKLVDYREKDSQLLQKIYGKLESMQ